MAVHHTAGGDEVKDTQLKLLLGRLDLTRPGLENVKTAADLLACYRMRTSVKHLVDRSKRAEERRKKPYVRDLPVADDAVKNILIAAPVYPRHDFGKKINWLKKHRDQEWMVQLHRHNSWTYLGRVYWRTGDEKYAETYTRQLADWLDVCFLKDTPSTAWRRIEMGIRGHIWMHHYNYFIDAPSYTPELLVTFLNCCYEHCVRLTGKSYTRNNWGLMEAEGTAFLAMMVPEFKKSEEWRKKAIGHLREQIHKQVRNDGHHVEQCLNYHMGCIRWFARTPEMAKKNGYKDAFPDKYWKKLEAMVDAVMKLLLPDGQAVQFGDTHTDRDNRRFLREWADFFEREDFLYLATKGKEGTAPAQTAYALKDSGFYSMRSGWTEAATCMVLQCGPHGGWHDQMHNGTFEVFAGGRRLTPDSGCYIYHGDDKGRAWFKQTRVHQTMTLDGKVAAQKPKLLLWKPGKDTDVLVVENAGYKGLTHRRAMMFVKKRYFVVVDEALGKATGNVNVHFQLAPTKAVFDKKGLSARTAFPDGVNLLVQGAAQPGVSLVEEKGQVSFKYGEKEPRPAFRYTAKKEAQPVRFVTVLAPYRGNVPKVSVSPVEAPPGAKKIEFDVTVGGKKTRVGYTIP